MEASCGAALAIASRNSSSCPEALPAPIGVMGFRRPVLGVASPLVSGNLVGPVRRNAASDASACPTGRGTPITGQPTQYHCEFPGCSRYFSTANGRGLHHRRAHPDWYDAQAISNQSTAKKRWTDEESAILARKEAELTIQGVPHINQALAAAFPERSLDSIKGHRRPDAYKERVQEIIEQLQALTVAPPQTPPASTPPSGTGETPTTPASEPPSGGAETPTIGRLLDYLASLPPIPASAGHQGERLEGLLQQAANTTREDVFQGLTTYLRDVLPGGATARGGTRNRQPPPPPPTRKKLRRRQEYARTQKHWRSSRARCIKAILDNEVDDSPHPPRDRMESYWTNVLTQPATNTTPDCLQQHGELDVWGPITQEEIKAARPSMAVAPGPDGITSRQLRQIPLAILVRVLNLFLWCEKVPRFLTRARTVFIPKKPGSMEPSDYRPITITSTLARLFHRILANRLDGTVDLDEQQRAFRQGIDGCRDNIVTLDAILRSRFESHKSSCIAVLDMAKAFDSVEHTTILECAKAAGLPPPMLRYLQDFYASGTTTLQGGDWRSSDIKPSRGVKQGDPLSPIIFNLVIDQLLRSLPKECGVSFGGSKIRAMAFADDLNLLAETPAGLQLLLDHTTRFLQACGLRINNGKSHSVTIRGLGKEKKSVVDASQEYTIYGQKIRALARSDSWTYLGVSFRPDGRSKIDMMGVITPLLQRLTAAPLKPQQRIYAVRTGLLPRIYYMMALGKTTISELNRVDKAVRAHVRQWLRLPNDVPMGYFHAPVGEGGLGISSVRWLAPLHRRNRLLGMLQNGDTNNCDDTFLLQELARANKRLTDGGERLTSQDDIKARWARQLHRSIEGKPLLTSTAVKGQHSWVADGTSLLTGRDYIGCHRARIGCLPTRSRTTRGRTGDRSCRAGCNAQETNNHVLQKCPRSHAARIRRHDAVVKYVNRRLVRMGYQTSLEPIIQTGEGVRKPDIIASWGNGAIVIDPQIASDTVDLERARRLKYHKYADNPDIERYIRTTTGATTIRHMPLVLSWRGVWSQGSAQDLLASGILNRRDLAIIATRVLIGNNICHREFANATSVR